MKKTMIPSYALKGYGAKKVIITNDWMGDIEGNWALAVNYLNTSEFTYAFVDVRGYGHSKDINGDFTIDEIASDIFKVADALDWHEFYLVGHSMTGMAAQKAILQDKTNRIKAMVGITPVSSAGFKVDDDTKAFFSQIITNPDVAATGYGMLVSDKLPKIWNLKRAERLHAQTNQAAMKSYMDEWLTKDFSEEMKGTTKPILIIYGEDDLEQWREKGQREAFQQFENVSFSGVSNAGHYPMQQVPIYTVQLMEAHLLAH
ncbi:alpha/beta fold hydrolase [Roseivirga sp. E12]|uniref:alpha/beta fold hydrolase n=1 Tax=Roseivirga sp. E12 TaxID=2819237 RepID=UPI001ABC7D1D|nr:alpha/beta hydrolase [Roseivirga sp. E12]MBO3696809.1 alpha/beta hydrolase [Roseivirga sp. E12]